jgi:AraC-like DNA-binding protein
MQPIIRPLLLLHPDRELKELLSEVPGQSFRLICVADWSALQTALTRAPLTAVSVVDPGVKGGKPAAELQALLSEFPLATVLAAISPDSLDHGALSTMSSWGVADFVRLGFEDSVGCLAHRLRLVRSHAIKKLLKQALPAGLPSRAQTLIVRAADVVSAGGGSVELASSLKVGVRTVPRWCERAELPPPRRLLAWLRLLIASVLLDDSRRSVASVARACGYAGEASLKNTVRDFFGVSPTELRSRGGFNLVARAFSSELEGIRDEAQARGRSQNVWLN